VVITPGFLDNPYSLLPDSNIPVPPSTVIHFDQNLKTARTGMWNLTLEREVGKRVLVHAAYIGSRGWRLYRLVNDNRIGSGQFIGRPPGERLFSAASGFITVSNLGFSSYQGMQLAAESLNIQRFGLQFGANYTWSHSIDNVSSIAGDDLAGGGAMPLDAFNPRLDKGSSDHDLRHRLAGNFIWQIPSLTRGEGMRRLLLAGWQLSGILSFQTGQPFSLRDSGVADWEVGDTTRPRVTGVLPKILSGNQMVADALAPNAFLFLPLNSVRNPDGSCKPDREAVPFGCQYSVNGVNGVNGSFESMLGRNTFWRPGTQYQNISIAKDFNLPRIGGREGMKLQYRAEFYNIFNHPNLYIKVDSGDVAAFSFNNTSGTSVPGVVASFGTPDRFPQEARQIVMALKLIF
jgi:hypothetical protein